MYTGDPTAKAVDSREQSLQRHTGTLLRVLNTASALRLRDRSYRFHNGRQMSETMRLAFDGGGTWSAGGRDRTETGVQPGAGAFHVSNF